jgi:hypothetical protein
VSDRLVRLAGVIATAAAMLAAVSAGIFFDLGVAVLVLAASLLLAAIAALWTSLQTLSGNVPMTVDEALALAHADAADEHKREVLQTLKDLEMDFGVGKIAPDDYEALVGQCRREAKRLLRASDEVSETVRAKATAYLSKRRPAGPAGRLRCAQCQTANDKDAVFCKKCGTRVASATGTKADDAP